MGTCISMNNNVSEPITKTTFTPTGNVAEDTQRALDYSKQFKLDQANERIAVIATTQGWETASKTMIADHTDKNGKFDYAAMRSQYG